MDTASETTATGPGAGADQRPQGAPDEPDRHPVLEVDDVVHQRVRLGILAVLHTADSADFSYLKQVLELTDGNLNRHLDVLARAGYVAVSKATSHGQRRTVATVTEAGRTAFDAEISQLERLSKSARQHRSRST